MNGSVTRTNVYEGLEIRVDLRVSMEPYFGRGLTSAIDPNNAICVGMPPVVCSRLTLPRLSQELTWLCELDIWEQPIPFVGDIQCSSEDA